MHARIVIMPGYYITVIDAASEMLIHHNVYLRIPTVYELKIENPILWLHAIDCQIVNVRIKPNKYEAVRKASIVQSNEGLRSEVI